MTHEDAFAKLARSAFRRRFALSAADRAYIEAKGLETVRRHAADFVEARLAPANPLRDGRQTPWKGHPVFVAQHATATCCRGCMAKWWKVPRGVPLADVQKERTVGLVMAWIGRQLGAGPDAPRSRSRQLTRGGEKE
ncbi:MAG TPA: DUF4186 domain-containing protein [Verrucomicrobia bacterium]|nr:DUF4186 domain-containing protein [Verrucomicrobiota bacterium]